MKKKILALALAVIMLMGIVPAVSAADMSYKAWDQGDSRWGYMSISSNGSGNNSMARVGCYVTAIAKILVHAGQQDPASFTPKECLQGLLAHGMLSTDGGIYYGNFNNSFLPTYGPELVKETSATHGAWSKSQAISEISGKINSDYYVIVCVNNKNTGNTHYMAVDYVGDDVYVMDNGGTVPLYGTWAYNGGVIDQVYFKYNGTRPYPAYTSSSTTTSSSSGTSSSSSGSTKTQYRYHRYEDGFGEYAVCAYYGNSLSTAAGPMYVRYTDWMDNPLPEITGGPSYLVHPFQGASCINAGCVERADSTSLRYRDSAGLTWYYEETRTVAAEEPAKPTPEPEVNCDNGHTWGTWETVTEPTCDKPGQQERACSVCGEVDSKTIKALGHNYQVKQDTKAFTLYVCANCGDSYVEEKEPETVDDNGMGNFVVKNSYRGGLFSDVKTGDWFAANVADAYELGLMNGTGSGVFSPGNNMTISEVVTLAARIHSIYYTGSDSFASYDGGNWYDPYVNYARENGIISENYSFTRPATREQVVHILAQALPEEELANTLGRISFADSVDITYMADVRLLSGAGVINGVNENGATYFKPLNPITRAEVAAIVGRMVQPSTRVK